MKTIYLDNAASTSLRAEVLAVMLPSLQNQYANPSSIHHQGRIAHDALQGARSSVAKNLKTKTSEIIFTSGGTEANNLAVFGVARAHAVRKNSGDIAEHRPHILISSIEHPSILEAGVALTGEGFDVEYIPVNQYGKISVNDVLSRVNQHTVLISVMLANNEIGTIEPIAELSKALKEKFNENVRPLFHTDACQATGQICIIPETLGVDLMTLNSSKIFGPKGVGMLYIREGVTLSPLLVGGTQELGQRAGTENVPSIIGFAYALSLALAEEEVRSKNLIELRDTFIMKLKKEIPEMSLNGHPIERLPNNIHISVPHVEGESIILMLDTYGICAGTGSACNADNLLPSHVLRAIGQTPEIIHGSVRFSLGHDTTTEDLEYTVNALAICVKKLKAMSPSPLHL